jgi:hypothetical protein
MVTQALWRRKAVRQPQRNGHTELAKRLRVTDLISIGIGSTIGAGVYVLVGTVARERAGPALTVSFLIAGIAAALAALCYAELSSRLPPVVPTTMPTHVWVKGMYELTPLISIWCFMSPLGFSLGQNPKLLTRAKLQFSLVLRSIKVEIK